MTRTKLADRTLPPYTRGEEVFNTASHIVGAVFGFAVYTICCLTAVTHNSFWALTGGVIYGAMMIFVYTVSSIYHALREAYPKKVMQVVDHCSIYAMIFGTYMPVLLTGIRSYSLGVFFALLAVLIVGTSVGVIFTAIDFHRYAVLAKGGYFVVGWCALFALRPLIAAFGLPFFLWLLAGGVAYCLGMIFYAFGRKKRYFHSVFHLFILSGSVLQFIGILLYCM